MFEWIKQNKILQICYFKSNLCCIVFIVLLDLHKFLFYFLRVIKKGTTGIEPVTTGTAVLCSTTELSALDIL